MSHGTAGGSWPPPPTGPPPGAERPGNGARGFGPLLAVVALVVLGCVLAFFAVRVAGAGRAEEQLAEPLRFLPVRSVQPGVCPAPGGDTFDDPGTGGCLTVDPVGGMVTERLRGAEAVYRPDAAMWVVRITFLEEDAEEFGELSGGLAGRQPPENQLAMILGERLLTAPSVQERLDGGSVEISGGFTGAEAGELAGRLGG